MPFFHDLARGFRALGSHPGRAALAVLNLALGIGLAASVFSIAYGMSLRGLPFPQAEDLMHLSVRIPDYGKTLPVAVHDYLDWSAGQQAFAELAAFRTGAVSLSGDGQPLRLEGAFIAAATFRALRVEPALGRAFLPAEDRPGAPPVVLLGHRLWQRRYGGDPGVVGRAVRIDGRAATIIGVMPRGFRFPVQQEIWLPLQADDAGLERGAGPRLGVFGRLRDGVTLDRARLEMATLGQRLEAAYPQANRGVVPVVEAYTRAFVSEDQRELVMTYLGGALFVLLIACSNVANLLLVRTLARSKEVAVRLALGGGRWRVAGHLLGESVVLCTLGGLLGLVLAILAVRFYGTAVADPSGPFWSDARIDVAFFGFLAAAVGLASLLAAAVPALRAADLDINAVLKDEGRGTSSLRMGRLSRLLVVGQVAFSCALLVCAGLMLRTIHNLTRIDFAFTTTDVFTAQLDLAPPAYPDAATRTALLAALLPELSALPGVRTAAAASSLPADGYGLRIYSVRGQTYASLNTHPYARIVSLTPGFFALFGVTVAEGRDFDGRDGAEAPPVAIVNRSLAAREWPGESALGKELRIGSEAGGAPWRTVVGVMPDMHAGGLENYNPDGFYVPLAQHSAPTLSLLARAADGIAPLTLSSPIRARLAAQDPDLPLHAVRTMREVIADNLFYYRRITYVLAALAGVALVLAASGVYGILSFAVGRRRGEMGIRLALGARRRSVLGLVMRQGLTQVVWGLLLGLALAAAATRLIENQLYQLEAIDPPTFLAIALLLTAVGALATLLPALRATRVDPTTALRYE